MKNLLTVLMAVLLFSCGSEPAKEEAPKTDSVAADTTKLVDVKPAFTPFKVVVLQQRIKNFAKAEAEYFSRDSLRKTYGISHYVIGRDAKDSNVVFVMDKIDDVDKAKGFYDLPSAKDAMKKAGVTNLPGITYVEFVSGNTNPVQFTEGVAVSHHVKDYAAWLKAFEAEGDASRKENGLITRGIARNLYDSNTVSILFEVSDMAKAKARVASPELKKYMTDAGVDSPPTVRWYTLIK